MCYFEMRGSPAKVADKARCLAAPPFLWVVELGYRIVAANRQLFARFLFRNE